MRDRLRGRARRVKLAAVAVLALAGHAAAQTAGNAAEWYHRAIDRLNGAGITGEQWQAVDAIRIDAPPTDEARAVLARLQPVFSAMAQGARLGASDFALDYDQGFDLTLPHLGSLRRITLAMAADARLRLHDGDGVGAASVVAQMYQVAGHLPQDHVLISSLVGQAVFKAADEVTQSGLDAAAFGPAESAALLDAVKPLAVDDPFGILDSMLIEQESVVGWMQDKYGTVQQRAGMMDELAEMGFEGNAADEVQGLLLLDQDAFDDALARSQVVLDRVVAVFDMDPEDARFELAALRDEIAAGEHGPLATLLLPDYLKLYDIMVQGEDLVTERLGVLMAVAGGDVEPVALANAAIWYVQAARGVEAMAPEDRRRFREAAGSLRRPEDGLSSLLEGAAELIELMQAGSGQQRCDFEFARHAQPGPLPWYLDGLRDAVRVLHCDALRHLHEGEPGAAAERLAIAYRVAAHLAGDRELYAARTAQAIHVATTVIVEWAFESLDEAHRATVRAAADAMPQRDPFGYQHALLAARRSVLEGLGLPPEPRRAAAATLRALTPARLLYLVTVMGTQPAAAAPPGCAGLVDVVDADALRAALADAGQAPAVERLAALSTRQVPDIARLDHAIIRAPLDLARAHRLLHPPAGHAP